MQFPPPKDREVDGGMLGGTQRGQGQQDPVWQSLVAQAGGPKQMRTWVAWGWSPPLAGHWVVLGMGQGWERTVTRQDGGRMVWGGWWDGVAVGWDSDRQDRRVGWG